LSKTTFIKINNFLTVLLITLYLFLEYLSRSGIRFRMG